MTSASHCMSWRQLGAVTDQASGPASATAKPRSARMASARALAMATPPRLSTREGRTTMAGLPAGTAPAVTTSLASPPQISSTRRVATSMAAGAKASSMPRSKRWRASVTSPSLRPVAAVRTGSKSAISRKPLAVSGPAPVATPPTTPPSPSTPPASTMTVISPSSA